MRSVVGVAEGGRRAAGLAQAQDGQVGQRVGADDVEVGLLAEVNSAVPPVASSTTCALVSVRPSAVKTTADPAPLPRRRAHGEAGDARQQARRPPK
jgi:hypothetical protein